MSVKNIILIIVAHIASMNFFANAQPAPGDECKNPLIALIGSNDFDTTNATSSYPVPTEEQCVETYLGWGESNPDVWFAFTPFTSGDYTFTTCDSNSFDTSMVLYEESCDNQVACNGDGSGQSGCQSYYSSIVYTLEKGKEYFVRIGGYYGVYGPGTLKIYKYATEDEGACCYDLGDGEFYCYDGAVDESHNESLCIKNGGEWYDGEDCSNSSSMCTGGIPTVWYVDQSNTNPGSGTSWSTAFIDVQDALDVASDGDQVWIVQGTYIPTDTGESNDTRDASFRLIPGVEMYGGFDGTEIDIDERQPNIFRVYLSGDLYGDDEEGGNNSENAYHVVVVEALAGNSPVLDGVFIVSGNADNDFFNDFGGGLLINNGQTYPIINRCSFESNEALNGAAIYVGSGGVYITSCNFVNNKASEQGGAIFSSSNATVVSMENSLISANIAEASGGAITNYGELLKLVNCTIAQNLAGFGGGLFLRSGSLTASNNIIWGNVEVNGSNSQIRRDGGTWDINYNCIQDLDGAIGGKGNIGTDPRFFNGTGEDNMPATGDERFQLMHQSPCIDAGDTTVVTVMYDLDGNDRVVDDPYTVDTGNNPTGGPIVDMGAYELLLGVNNLSIWSGANSNLFGDPENWLPSGVPDIEDTAMFDLLGSKFVQIAQSRYLNSLYITKGDVTFDIRDTVLTLLSQSDPLRVTPFDAATSATFKGEGGILRVTGPLNLQEGNISFIEGTTFEAPNVELGEGFEFFLDGNFVGNLTNIGSRVLPGGDNIGVINIEGNLSHQGQDVPNGLPVGVLSFDIAGRNAGDFDKMSIKGHADMTSAIELRWDPEYTPIAGDSYDLITANTASGNPSVVYCIGLPPTLSCRWVSPGNGIRGSGPQQSQ